tara:strand:- start:14371 stop:14979 length:609 start_codon:yes stop_codon:yes gene_type:complete
MSNENENKRIDLTQFERILNGPWSLVDGSEVLVCPTEECLGWCECGKGVPTKGPWIWQYIIGTDIGTGHDMNIASINQTMDEIMGWDNDGNYNIPSKEEGIAYATAKAVQMLPNLIAELKRCYEHMDTLSAIWCNTCEKHFDESDYGINYHRITVPDDSLMYEYREDMQEHCIECMETSEAIEKNCICDLCQQYLEKQNASD